MNIEICETRPPQLSAVQIQAPSDQSIQKLPIKPTAHHANHDKPDPGQSTSLPGQISLSHQIRIKSAEYWLRLGEADEAVRELEALPSRSWNHPPAVKVRVAALEVLGERTGAIVEE